MHLLIDKCELRNLCSENQYRLLVPLDRLSLQRIKISPQMGLHHFPSRLLTAIEFLATQQREFAILTEKVEAARAHSFSGSPSS